MHLYTDSIDGLRQAVCRTGERLSAVELANDAEAYLQRMQEVLARNTFHMKRQHDIEPPLGPTLEQEQDRGISQKGILPIQRGFPPPEDWGK